MSYKHRNSTSYRKKSMDKFLLKKQSSSTDDSRMDRDRKIETIELKDDNYTKREEKENQHEETSFIFPKSETKTGTYAIRNSACTNFSIFLSILLIHNNYSSLLVIYTLLFNYSYLSVS